MAKWVTWTADGLHGSLPARSQTGALDLFLVLLVAAMLGSLWLGASSGRAPEPDVQPVDIPGHCAAAPWSCPVGPEGLPVPDGTWDNGISPDEVYRVALGVGAGTQDLGPGGDAQCLRFLRGGGTPLLDAKGDCLSHMRDQLVADRLTVPATAPGASPRVRTRAAEWKRWQEERLQRQWAALSAQAAAQATASQQASLEAAAASRATTLRLMALSVLAGLMLILGLLLRRHQRRPIQIRVTPQGLLLDGHVFPRSAITSVRVDEAIGIRLTDGSFHRSRPLGIAKHDELRNALESLLLSDEDLLAERAARPEVEAALDPLTRR